MASFTNFATLSYNGGTTNSNTVTGELLEALTVTKTAVVKNYAANDKITYIISIVNSGEYGQLYAQAVAALRAGERYWFTPEAFILFSPNAFSDLQFQNK